MSVTHKCYCGKDYDCPHCSTPGQGWMCSTLNGDEDSNMCDECLDKFADDYNRAMSQEAKAAEEEEEQHALEYATGLGDRLEDDYGEESKP